MGKSSAPPAPDYVGAAQAQGASSEQVTDAQTYANRPNVTTPWGQQTYSQSQGIDPATGKPVTLWNQNISLNPQEQTALDSQQAVQTGRSQAAQGLLAQATNSFGSPTDFADQPQLFQFGGPSTLDNSRNTTPSLQTSIGDPGQFNSQAQQAVYGQMAPLLQRNREATEAQLANQGIVQGSEAWKNAQEDLGRNENNAILQATQAGFSQGATDFNEAGQNAALGNTANQQMYTNAQGNQQQYNQTQAGQQNLNTTYGNYQTQQQQQYDQNQEYQRTNSLNELNALLTGQQVSNPSFSDVNKAGASQGVDYTGAAKNQYGAAMDAFSVDQANQQSTNSSIGAAVGTIATIASYY